MNIYFSRLRNARVRLGLGERCPTPPASADRKRIRNDRREGVRKRSTGHRHQPRSPACKISMSFCEGEVTLTSKKTETFNKSKALGIRCGNTSKL